MANKQREIEKSEDLSKLMFGRVMPQALELEEVVLGACMLDKEAFSCLLYTSPSPRDRQKSRMPSSA